MQGGLRGIEVNVLYCDVVESEFELQSLYYLHFWTNILRKEMKSLFPPTS